MPSRKLVNFLQIAAFLATASDASINSAFFYKPNVCGDGFAMPEVSRIKTVETRSKLECFTLCKASDGCVSLDTETLASDFVVCHFHSEEAGEFGYFVERNGSQFTHYEIANSETTAVACTQAGLCPPGTYSSVPGQTCDWCMNGEKQSTCAPCAAGSSQSAAGQTACDPCPLNTYTDTEGQTSCINCQSGHTTSGTGSTACAPPLNNQYRLSGGSSTAGRVEVYHNNEWGTICDDGFTNTNAQVLCRSLGLSYSSAVQHQSAHFGQGSGSILMDNVNCGGTENELSACTHNGWGVHNCGHGEDVGVTCQ